jgi:predicted transcriptional regulator
MRNIRVCIRIPTEIIKQLDEIDASTDTRSYKVRQALKQYLDKESNRIIDKLTKK